MEDKREFYFELSGTWNEKGTIVASDDQPIYLIGKILELIGQMDPGDEIKIVCY